MLTNDSLADTLAPLGDAMMIPKAAMLFDVGELCSGVYIIRSGSVDLLLLNAANIPVWSRCVSAGGVLGLPAAVGMKQYSLRAVAHDNAELVFVPATTIQSVIRNDPNVGFQVLKAMSEEVATLRKKVAMFDPGKPDKFTDLS